MFCPKCGIQNPETGKFCRTCGTDLSNVSDALTGKSAGKSSGFGSIEPLQPLKLKRDKARRSDPNEAYGDAVKSIISGIGFIIISMVLLFTGVAGGRAWWWAMLFPAFTFLAKGISEYLKYNKMEKSGTDEAKAPAHLSESQSSFSLPPKQTEYAAPETRYETSDLVPPSVTEGTTKLLEIDSEGETQTVPKK